MGGSLPEGLIDLNAAARYDDDLRQVPIDSAAIERAIHLAAGALADARTREDDAAALPCATADQPRELANLIRLAEAFRYWGDLDRTEALFRDALERCVAPDLASYADFVLQHLGKCRLDRGDPAEAVTCFECALVLRCAKGDRSLIRSTQQVLRLARIQVSTTERGLDPA